MSDLQSRLQSAIGDTYRIEGELGGGGMSRVFVAMEVRLDRRVVIKVLPPEMAAGVSIDRFEREILVAAKLQHPHVVSLLTAGAHDDLLYYVMPLIEGESLRAKLAREGELPIGEALSILREVADALGYAHKHGVVHRDIKPDNVLLADGHALVTDFGVAKAVSDSTGEAALTSVGVALGTPAYMSPEQAAANPNVDHRADIYALGALAYEMLCGRPPFAESSPQALLAAHVARDPEPCTTHRGSVSPVLNEVVMRCLVKLPADRWQSADELKQQFDAITTPSGGVKPTGAQPLTAVSAELVAHRNHPVRVVGLFGLAAIGALAIVYFLTTMIGLPDWVLYGAAGLLAVGLPIVLLTGHHERRRAAVRTTGTAVATSTGMQRHFTWRKSVLGGGLAFAGLGVVTGVYMVMRALGIGPAATLVSSGVLTFSDTLLLVADFDDRADDPGLAQTVKAALEIDLAESPLFGLVTPQLRRLFLQMMQRDPETPVAGAVASQLAQRLGLKAMVTGEVGKLGNAYALNASLVSPADGQVYAAFRETAKDEDALVDAVDRLSSKMRERIGESLRSIRRSAGLAFATTSSMQALRLYTRATQAEARGDPERAIALLEEAVTVDTTFAEAYRKMAVTLNNAGLRPTLAYHAASKAYEHRERLNPIERYAVTAYYFARVEFDADRAVDAYRAGIEEMPGGLNVRAMNNTMVLLNEQRRWREAEEIGRDALELLPETFAGTAWTLFTNQLNAQLGQDRVSEAESTVTLFGRLAPESHRVPRYFADLALAIGEYDRAEPWLDSAQAMLLGNAIWQRGALGQRRRLAAVRGQVGEGQRHLEEALRIDERQGNGRNYLIDAATLATLELVLRDDAGRGRSLVDSALAKYPLEQLDPMDRPYLTLAVWYARSGDVATARGYMDEYEAEVPQGVRRRFNGRRVEGLIAREEGRLDDAIERFRAFYDASGCAACGLFELGQLYDMTGQSDSAIATYERALTTPGRSRLTDEYLWKAGALKRLGELYEARDDTEKAVEYYNEFVELWQNADAEFQPPVREVRGRIARLVGEGR